MNLREGIKGLILRQAEIYPPRQAEAAAIHEMEHFTSWIAARALRQPSIAARALRRRHNRR